LLFLLCFFLSFATLLFCAFSLCCFTFFFWLSSLFRALVQIELSVVLFLMVFYPYLGPNRPLGEA
jgi:hypothetical protein